MLRRLLAMLGVASVALAAAGCSGDDSSAPVSLPGKVDAHGTKDLKGDSRLQMELDDFYFGPTFVKAKAGTSVTVTLKNDGAEPHTFTIDGVTDREVAPGAQADVAVTMPATGALVFYCRFHRASGMQGAFTVS